MKEDLNIVECLAGRKGSLSGDWRQKCKILAIDTTIQNIRKLFQEKENEFGGGGVGVGV